MFLDVALLFRCRKAFESVISTESHELLSYVHWWCQFPLRPRALQQVVVSVLVRRKAVGIFSPPCHGCFIAGFTACWPQRGSLSWQRLHEAGEGFEAWQDFEVRWQEVLHIQWLTGQGDGAKVFCFLDLHPCLLGHFPVTPVESWPSNWKLA